MKRYAGTQDEIAGLLGMSRQQFGKYAKRPDAPGKTGSGYNVNQWTEYVKSVKDSGLKGDGSLKDEKTLREIERLDIIIKKERGELVDKKEEALKYEKLINGYRKAIDDWRGHETAKNPDFADQIDGLAERLEQRIRESYERD